MNGWAKCAGILSIIAGIVFFIAIGLALSDGLTLEEGVRLSAFLANDKFDQIAIFAGLILLAAAVTAVAAGVSSKKGSVSIAGDSFGVFAPIILVTVLKNVTGITERSIAYDYLGAFFFLALAVLVMGFEKRRYALPVIAVALAVVLYLLYLIALLGGMVTVFIGIILLILAGVTVAVPVKLTAEEIEAAAAKQAECDDLLEQGWKVTVAKVGEDKANDMSDEEIMAVIREEDEDLYNKIAEATGLSAAYTHTAVPHEEAEHGKTEAAESKEGEAAKDSELDKLLEQGWNVATAKVGDKAEDMSDEEIMAVIREEDEDLYNKISEATGLKAAETEADKEAAAKEAAEKEAAEKAAAAKEAEEKAAAEEKAKADAEAAAKAAAEKEAAEKAAAAAAATAGAAAAVAASEDKKDEPAEEQSELDRLLEQGWNVTVAEVGEDRAEEMSDYEIMAVISVADPPLYEKLSALTGIVVSTGEEPEGEMSGDEDFDDDDFELEPDTPAALLRRACWNKGLRCRKNYGPYFIPVAFVKSKVAVYIDAGAPDHSNDEILAKKGWIVLHFDESKVTDGAEEAQVVYDAVKENMRAMKKAKSKSKAKKKR